MSEHKTIWVIWDGRTEVMKFHSIHYSKDQAEKIAQELREAHKAIFLISEYEYTAWTKEAIKAPKKPIS